MNMRPTTATIMLFTLLASLAAPLPGSDLSYESYFDSDNRLKCMYGYFAHKTGDHRAAIRIFEDCIRRWDDVYSMIGLAHIYENGMGVPRDLEKATALVRQGALTDDQAGYSSIARYHYGVALYEGLGVERDLAESQRWLRAAADEGVDAAREFLLRFDD